MNEDVLKGKWKDIKGEIQKTWGKLTGDELEQTKGDAKSITGLLQQKYGIAKEEATDKIARIFNSYDDKTEDMKTKMRTDINESQRKS